MSSNIVVGPFNRGLRNDVTPFNIDNESFPVLINAYQWRGRVKRKRGTSLLGRLQRFLGTTNGAGNLVVTISPQPIDSGIASFTVGSSTFTDPGGASPIALLVNGSGTANLDRTTGVLTIAGSDATTAVIYFPRLPVMGLEDLSIPPLVYPGTLAFDTHYAYNIATTRPATIYDVSFYKNPSTASVDPLYVAKSTWTSLWWNGQDYQQFWTTNYQGALWATNGIDVPFTGSTIGMQFAGPGTTPALTVATRTSATTMDFTVVGNPLVVGDFVFANEFVGSAGGSSEAINFQTGFVTTAGNVFTVTFPSASIPAGTYAPGILQYLTNRSDTSKDNIRWYDGDPTNGVSPAPSTTKGWVNFMPPLSQNNYSIADLPLDQYYLVGARMIIPFKDRLIFIGPVVQTSSASATPIYLQDTFIFSQNGTPYYTASFQGDPRTPTAGTPYESLLVPVNQTAFPAAWFEDSTGFGGFLSAGIEQPAITVASNEDVLIVGFQTLQTKLVYTGNDVLPFTLFIINSELGSSSTFSAINMDEGVVSRGNRGIVITNQTSCKRSDLEIPDEVFEINLLNNGAERFCAQRDFIQEWIYYTYPTDESDFKFPDTTLQYNYRDGSWAKFIENYTTYGTFRYSQQLTWATVGNTFPTWAEWNEPWNGGTSSVENPLVIGGNQQGFVLIRGEGTGEDPSLYISDITGSTSTITSPSHGLHENDYIYISSVLGAISTQVNGNIFKVGTTTTDTFTLEPSITSAAYEGGGVIKRLYIPLIQSKQFPTAWAMGRKTRLGLQQYLLTTTEDAQITLAIFLSQNSDSPYNAGPIIPDPYSPNNSLVYSTVLYTCPESANLGLTAPNYNLQMPTAIQQSQIWHRVNTSLIGDTVQLGFTLSDTQMTAVDDDGLFISQEAEIEIHGIILNVSPSQVLS